jgi:trimethylamine--corrinoid protein Co-methyltransferase
MIMDKNFVVRPSLSVLSRAEIDAFYSSALDVLERVGVRVLHPEALQLLERAGAPASGDSIVRIRSVLVQDALRTVPKRLMIYDREGNPAMELGGGNRGGTNTYYGTGSDLKNTYDPHTGELRLTVTQDIADMARVVDALPNLDFLMSYGIPYDCPLETVFQTEFDAMVRNSTKPIVFTSQNAEDSRIIVGMAAAAAGGTERLRRKPFVLNYTQPTSPLQHSSDGIGKLLAGADLEVPIVYPPGMMPGATAPVTVAGAITQSLAEALSGLVIHQLKRMGAPIVLCGAHGCMDMHTAINVYAAPERLLSEAALAAIYQHFGVPTWGFGGCTDAHILDEQAGAEFGTLTMWAALCGINLAHDVGYLGSGMIGDLRAVLMNNEIVWYVRHVLCRGIPVDHDTLATDAIASAGPGGNYMGHEHTIRHFRTQLWRPAVFNRMDLGSWTRKGKNALKEVLAERLHAILRDYAPKPLDPAVSEELDRLMPAEEARA